MKYVYAIILFVFCMTTYLGKGTSGEYEAVIKNQQKAMEHPYLGLSSSCDYLNEKLLNRIRGRAININNNPVIVTDDDTILINSDEIGVWDTNFLNMNITVVGYLKKIIVESYNCKVINSDLMMNNIVYVFNPSNNYIKLVGTVFNDSKIGKAIMANNDSIYLLDNSQLPISDHFVNKDVIVEGVLFKKIPDIAPGYQFYQYIYLIEDFTVELR